MKLYKENDGSKGYCYHCRSVVDTTFQYAPFRFKGSKVEAQNVLQDFCNNCKKPVSIPPQSIVHLKHLRNTGKKKDVELRIPKQIEDLANILGSEYKINARKNQVVRLIAKFYLNYYYPKDKKSLLERIKNVHEDDFLEGKKFTRISFKWSKKKDLELENIAKSVKLKKSDVFRAILILAKNDLLEKKNSPVAKRFKEKDFFADLAFS